MMVTFRIDDVSLYMDWEKFNRLAGMFRVYNIKPLMGVIPDNQDPELQKLSYDPEGWEKIAALKNGGWTTAQHGCRHLYTTKNPGLLGINPYSEFAGLPYQEQLELLLRGKELLQERGLDSCVFMAPAHAYDQNTLKALSQLGFLYLTDGYSVFPYKRLGLKCIPCQTSKPVRLAAGIVTVCLHPNTMTDADFISLEQWLAANRKTICDYSRAMKYPSLGLISRAIELLVLLIRKARKRRLLQ